jgi:hypothetical protein
MLKHNKLFKGEISRDKKLEHDLRDGTRWRDKDGKIKHSPDIFEMFDGQDNVGSEIT